MPTLHGILEFTQRLRPSKWYFDINHYAESIGITTAEANGFFKCIADGGVKQNESWTPNPAPYDGKINLTSPGDNLLNLHLTDFGKKSVPPQEFSQPPKDALSQSGRFVFIRRVSRQNKEISPKI